MNTRTEIVIRAKKHYNAQGSHGWEHIQETLRALVRKVGRALTDKELAAVCFHDCSQRDFGSEDHEVKSADIMRAELIGLLDTEAVEEVAIAIEDHRASKRNERLLLYGMLHRNNLGAHLAEADKGRTRDTMIRRTLQYAQENYRDIEYQISAVSKYLTEYSREEIREMLNKKK